MSTSRRPGPAAIRRALAECLTSSDIDALMGWTAGSAAKARHRGELPEPDAQIGRTPLWFRASIDVWRAARPGRGVGGGRPRGYSPKRAEVAS